MDLIVSPAVLIPRPETEHLIEELLARVGRVPSPAKLRIVDVGTGSGCIALALAKELPQVEIHAVDISPAALEIARANAVRLQLESRIQFHEADLLDGIEADSFNFVVSTRHMLASLKKTQFNSKFASLSREMRCLQGATGLEAIELLIPTSSRSAETRWLAGYGNQRDNCGEGRGVTGGLGKVCKSQKICRGLSG